MMTPLKFQKVWDCGLEHNAWLKLCDSSVPVDPFYTETAVKSLDTKGTPCNVTAKTLDVLKTFAEESNAVDLSGQNPKRSDAIANFAVMIAQDAKGFACTYQKCSGSTQTKFVCLYDTLFVLEQVASILCVYLQHFSLRMVADNQTYESIADKSQACDACPANGNKPKCIKYLCQYEYTLAEDAYPWPICYDDMMTADMQDTALYMHNYYRKLIATGWAKDKNGYAPRAKNMNALEYDCDNIGEETAILLNCTNPKYTPTSGYSLNYEKFSLDVTPLDGLQKAISGWYDQLKNVDLDDKATYTSQIETNAKNFANMAVAQATKFGCAAERCQAQGYNIVACQYNSPPDIDSPLYEVGKPCAGCDKATTTCDQADGLCVTK
ncbi:SCP-like protein [Ancylostoma caninum]|uniref:SCP-like protein n=1 Tax=Ancylostoma caninum TaxID=29170 RepID=A0A368GS82_ANCCA|nr:SCP-like protein [Ancylostoma caninum]